MDKKLKASWRSYPRPILRWAGSKRRLVPSLLQCVPNKFNRYFEPFFGSGCLFLALNPRSAVLGDCNVELIEVYKYLRDHPIKLARAVRDLPATKEFYYKIRSEDPNNLDQLSSAARFIFLNRYCFNGIYRTNQKGQFNVPMGVNTGSVPSNAEFLQYSKALRNSKLEPIDFSETVKPAKKGDFVYLDPPYAKYSRNDSGEYGYNSFNEDDIDRLIETVRQLHKRGATIVMSYANTELFQILLDDGWDARNISVRRNIAGFKSKRGLTGEVLMSNYELPIDIVKEY